MKKLGDLLNSQNLDNKLSREEERKNILDTCWTVCMGEACSSHTNRLDLKNGVLTVFVDSQVWQQELMLNNRKKMASDMARETGFTIVDVRIKTGG